MKTANPTLLQLIQSFFQHLQEVRGTSPHTIRAYRDTFRLFFEFLAQRTHRGVDRLTLSDVTASRALDFLGHLETQRGNLAVTVALDWLRYALGRNTRYVRTLRMGSNTLASSTCQLSAADKPRLITWNRISFG